MGFPWNSRWVYSKSFCVVFVTYRNSLIKYIFGIFFMQL